MSEYYKQQQQRNIGGGSNRPFGYRPSPRISSVPAKAPTIGNNEKTFPSPPAQFWSNTPNSRVTSPKTGSTSATATTTTNVSSGDSANEQWRAWRPSEEASNSTTTSSSSVTWFSPSQTASTLVPPSTPLRNSGTQSPRQSIIQQQRQFSPKRSSVQSSTASTTSSNGGGSSVGYKHNAVTQEQSRQPYEDRENHFEEEEVVVEKQRKHSIWSDDWDDGYDEQVFSNNYISSTTKTTPSPAVVNTALIEPPARSGWTPEPPEEEEEESEENIKQYNYSFIGHKREPRDLSIEDICVESLMIRRPKKQQQQQQSKPHDRRYEGFDNGPKDDDDGTYQNAGPQLRRGATQEQKHHQQQQRYQRYQDYNDNHNNNNDNHNNNNDNNNNNNNNNNNSDNNNFLSASPSSEQPVQVLSDTSSPFMYPVFFGKPSPDHYQQYNSDGQTLPTQQQHMKQRNTGNNNKWRKDNTGTGFSYPPYLSSQEIEDRSNLGELHTGVLRINRHRRYDAYVSTTTLDDDVYIGSELSRNRAFDSDIVVIELVDVDVAWKQRKEVMQRYRAKDEYLGREAEQEVDIDYHEALDDQDEYELPNKPKYAGKVVGITERPKERYIVGMLAPEPKHSTVYGFEPKIWFRPLDKRIPLFYIPNGNGPTDVKQNEDYYKSRLFVAKMITWQPHKMRPVGEIIRELGQIGEMSVETQAILTDCCITSDPYSDEALASIPSLPFTIPESELAKRNDMRDIVTFTIDPSTAKDLDDALHIKRTAHGFEVGVHIADVSYFVRPNTPLDSEARDRGTSTYLVDGVLPMLPEVLCQDLCSLNQGQDRLTFSVIWQMDNKGNVIDTSFSKAIIRSKAQLSYEDAQKVINGGHLDPSIPHATEIEQAIQDLMGLAQHMRDRRFASGGALAINTVKLEFELNKETREPVSATSYEHINAHHLIEEFMLQANISASKKISEVYPNDALLRRHRGPIIRRMDEFVQLAQELGFNIDAESAGKLQKSFELIPGGEIKQALFALAIRSMQRAKYFCSGTLDPSRWLHYALNEQTYTHFTSPIRRYADIVVHRQLEYAMMNRRMSGFSKKTIQSISYHCNYRKEHAVNAQEMSRHLYLGRYLSLQKAPVVVSATVILVELDFIEIYQHTYGLKRRLYVEDCPITHHEFDSDQNIITWYWKPGVQVDMESHMRKRYRTKSTKRQDSQEQDGNNPTIRPKNKKGHVNTRHRAPPQQLVQSLLNQDACAQIFSVFSTLNIRLQVNTARSPPIINAYPVNPFY